MHEINVKSNNAKKQKNMAAADKDSHDERECSENGASTINRSAEPSLTDRGRLTTDYLFGKEPEFLFQAFVGCTGVNQSSKDALCFRGYL